MKKEFKDEIELKDSYFDGYEYKGYNEAFCLNCGWSYKTVEGKLSKEELQYLKKEYEWKERDKK